MLDRTISANHIRARRRRPGWPLPAMAPSLQTAARAAAGGGVRGAPRRHLRRVQCFQLEGALSLSPMSCWMLSTMLCMVHSHTGLIMRYFPICLATVQLPWVNPVTRARVLD